MEFMETIKTFDLVFVFIFCLGLTCASFGYLISEIISSVCDCVKTRRRKRREKREQKTEEHEAE